MDLRHREWSQRDIEIFRKALKRGGVNRETARLLVSDGREIWAKGTELGFVIPRKDEESLYTEERAEVSLNEKRRRGPPRARRLRPEDDFCSLRTRLTSPTDNLC
jgi:hypothetical protein